VLALARDLTERIRAEEERHKLSLEKVYLQEEIEKEHNFGEIIGSSKAIKQLFRNIKRVAGTDSTVLITGETGTGKELVARAIHAESGRKDRVLIKVNCAALAPGLIESELFGHEKGAFTGAVARREGRFEAADGGTIFLDEIGDFPGELQVKLLRVLQDGEFERVGGTRTMKVDVRVIAATNRDLERAVGEGRFRTDLYYRLKVYPIHVPPLRDRKEDVPLLVNYFAGKYGSRLGKKLETVPQGALDALMSYPWPGNIRELENVIERAVIVSTGSELELGDWIGQAMVTGEPGDLLTLDEMQRRHITKVLEHTGWRVSGPKGAARILGVKPTTLAARMKKLGIARPGND
jgi:transcriptional regulator with GAF, ATPase, and Fis domain